MTSIIKRLVFPLTLYLVIWGLYQIATRWPYQLHQTYLSADESTLLVVSRIDGPRLARKFRLDVIDLATSDRSQVIYQRDLGWPPMEFAISASGRLVAITTESKLRIIDTQSGYWSAEREFQLPLSNYYGYISFTEDERSVYFHYHYEQKLASESIVVLDLASGDCQPVWFPPRVQAVQREVAAPPMFATIVVDDAGVPAQEYFKFTGGELKSVQFNAAEKLAVAAADRSLPRSYVAIDSRVINVDLDDLTITSSQNNSVFVESPYRWWPHVAVAVVAAAILWWLLWCYLTRQPKRRRPTVNIGLLYLLGIGTCWLRLATDPEGPNTNHVGFWISLGVIASFICLCSHILVHGEQRFGTRISLGMFVMLLVIAILVSIERNFELWSAGWGILIASVFLTFTALTAMVRRYGLRMRQGIAGRSRRSSQRRFQIIDLLSWTLLSALALMLIRLMNLDGVKYVYVLSTLSVGCSLAATATIVSLGCLAPLRARFRWPLAALLAPVPAVTVWMFVGEYYEPWNFVALFGGCATFAFLWGFALRVNHCHFRSPGQGTESAAARPPASPPDEVGQLETT